MTLSIKAHAKINPYLWVGDIQPDGYHEIDTVLQAVELHDTVSFTTAQATVVRCSDPDLSGESNLVSKAHRLVSEIVDLQPLDIFIEKRIPLQAGLGGGSSDCAAALRVFDRLARGGLDRHLMEIAAACGSDVPFFLGATTRARATGKGERLEALPPVEATLVIAKPVNVACNTGEAYGRLDAIQNRSLVRPDSMPFNDFERVAPCESLELLDRMRTKGIVECGLCGSGSAVYGFTNHAKEIAQQMMSPDTWAVATKTIRRFGDPWTP